MKTHSPDILKAFSQHNNCVNLEMQRRHLKHFNNKNKLFINKIYNDKLMIDLILISNIRYFSWNLFVQITCNANNNLSHFHSHSYLIILSPEDP